MENRRIKRKKNDGSTDNARQRQDHPSQSAALTQPTPLQSAPPAVRLPHSSSTTKDAQGGLKKHDALSTESSETTSSDNVPVLVQQVLRSPGQPLDSEARTRLELRTGHDFGHLRVHTDEQAAASARALESLAYTAGSHLVFGEGQYAPHTAEGDRLLAHEAAHALHQTEAGSSLAGIAPPDSLAERRADEFAAAVTNPASEHAGLSPELNFRDWGAAWHIHPQRIVTKGTVAHTGEVGAPPAGQAGAPVGKVEVRTGEELEQGGRKLPNRIALEYGGALADVSKWLQFVWFELVATTPKGDKRVSGNVPTSSGNKPFTTDPRKPDWTVDSGSTTDPFYESAARNIRTSGGTTIFDAPGGASATPFADDAYAANPTATAVTFIAHFDSYLIQKMVAAYHVAWTATTSFTRPGGTTTASAIVYNVGASGPVTALPANLKKILQTSYSSYPDVKKIQ
ncbi:MAG TPA: DUF4157 domain-containing protein [Pyrinomonadaceae bacterium]|jgi:hypothetical protein